MASRGFFFRNRGHIRLISGSHHAFSMDCPPLAPVVALSPGRSFYAGSTHNRDGVVKSGEPASRLSRRNEAARQSPVFPAPKRRRLPVWGWKRLLEQRRVSSAPQMPPTHSVAASGPREEANRRRSSDGGNGRGSVNSL